MSLQLMKERIKQSGNSLYDEQIKDAQDSLSYGFTDDVSYNKNIVTYKTNEPILIKMYDQKYNVTYGFTVHFLSPHDIPIELGKLLYNTKKDEYWLCVESYDVSGIHNEGKLAKCSRFIKWQEKDGSIQEIPVISRNATQYNNGEYSNKTLTLGTDQIMMYTQLNEHTVKLDHGIKFFVDENKGDPTVYELTKPDTVDYSYMGKGMISLMLTECAYTPTKKELELGVCDYTEHEDITTSLPLSDETTVLKALISGNRNLRNSYKRTYTIDFTDHDGEAINWRDIDFQWNIISDWDITQNKYENKIDLFVDDEDLIESSFLLQVLINNTVATEMKITVTE